MEIVRVSVRMAIGMLLLVLACAALAGEIFKVYQGPLPKYWSEGVVFIIGDPNEEELAELPGHLRDLCSKINDLDSVPIRIYRNESYVTRPFSDAAILPYDKALEVMKRISKDFLARVDPETNILTIFPDWKERTHMIPMGDHWCTAE